MAKFGISLAGISHSVDWIGTKHGAPRSYLTCKNNFLQNLLHPLQPTNTVHTYLTTYLSSQLTNIVNFYQPKKFQFINFNDSHQSLTFLESLELLRGEDLDFVICTRFDIFFRPGILKNLNFDLNKFNFLFREKDHWDGPRYYGFACDCFFMFPYKFLYQVIAAATSNYLKPTREWCQDIHQLYVYLKPLIGVDNINFASDKLMYSHENDIYELKRGKELFTNFYNYNT